LNQFQGIADHVGPSQTVSNVYPRECEAGAALTGMALALNSKAKITARVVIGVSLGLGVQAEGSGATAL
jgi:hypothetical protein